jgi:hypothetical protein
MYTLLPEAALSPEVTSSAPSYRGEACQHLDLAVNPVVKANNLAAAYCFCFLKCLNCCSIRLFLHHTFRRRPDDALRRVARSSRPLNRYVD